jgi:hypothetical protein
MPKVIRLVRPVAVRTGAAARMAQLLNPADPVPEGFSSERCT